MCKIPSISSHIPRPSAGCNFSPKQFRLNVLPEAGNSARGQKLRLKPFWPNSPRRIFLRWNRSKNSGAGSFARFTLNYAWITSSFAWFFFLMGKCKMMQNAVLFSCRLKVSPELGISPAGCCFSLQIAKRHFLGLGCPFAMYQMFSVTHNILSLGLHECIGKSSWRCYMPRNCCGAWKDSQMSKWVYLRRSSWTYHQIRKTGPSKRYWQLTIRLEFEVCKIPSISSHIPRPSTGCNFSPSQFRLSVLPEAGNSARGQKLRLKQFGQSD